MVLCPSWSGAFSMASVDSSRAISLRTADLYGLFRRRIEGYFMRRGLSANLYRMPLLGHAGERAVCKAV